ncbi:MAG: amidohydrolase family protein [Lachnospiraceae bacterium]|nr:amidohydrolase family protein [Ruminococcus sp.]MCM1274175.1 amidohydrolase family protein [Lachnospiraceae bacterium]
MVIKNVKIKTMSDKDYENGFVRFGEIITEIGEMSAYIPTDEDEIDGSGKTLYPGFIDAHCHLGMWSDCYSMQLEGDDGNEMTDPSTPHLRAIDSINAMDRCFSDAVNAGVTCVCTGVGSANPIGGSFALIRTFGSKRVDKLVVKSPIAIKFALGENPKSSYSERDETPVTRMATAAIIREQLRKALRYKEDMDEYKRTKGTDDEVSKPDFDAKCEALLPLFNKENKLKAHFHCHRADDIFTAVRIAKEFELDYVLIHCTDGGVIADELAEDSPAAVTGPLFGDRGKPELSNHDITTPRILYEHGMECAICTDHPETPIQYLPMTAALAVRGGLSEENALRAITINAARVLGVGDILGSVEVGKSADFVLFGSDKSPLDIMSLPSLVVVGGKIAVKK